MSLINTSECWRKKIRWGWGVSNRPNVLIISGVSFTFHQFAERAYKTMVVQLNHKDISVTKLKEC